MKLNRIFLTLSASLFFALGPQKVCADSPRLVFRDKVEPHWFAGPEGVTNRFWYRVETGSEEHEYILVDAAAGKRNLAFNHVKVAEALSKALAMPMEAKKLPLDELDFARDGKSVVLRRSDKSWRLDLETYSLIAIKEELSDENRLAAERAPHPSTDTGPETRITFVNRLGADVKLFWIDPDGKRLPYGTIHPGESHEQHTFAGHVWLVTLASGEQQSVFEATPKSAFAVIDANDKVVSRRRRQNRSDEPTLEKSPDGKWDVLVKGDNLWLRDAKAEKDAGSQMSFDANPNSSYARNAEADRSLEMDYSAANPEAPTPEVYWSPDSKHFVAMRFQPGTKRRVYLIESSPEDQIQPKLDSYPYLKPGDQVPIHKPHLFDVGTKKEIRISDSLFANPWSISDIRWNPDSAHFTFLFNQRGHQALRIVSVDAHSGEARAIVDEQSKTFIDYSGKMFCQYLDDTGEIIWASERDGWNHLYLCDANSGAVKNQITHGNWVVSRVEYVDKAKRQIWFRAGGVIPGQDPYYTQWCRVDFNGTSMTVLSEGDGTHEAQFSPDRSYFVDSWSRVDQAPISVLRRSSDGKQVCALEEADASKLLASGWQMPERFAAPGRDGVTEIYGVIWRPKDFDVKKKYPVIEDIYAGPQGFFTPKNFHVSYQQQKLADHGFVVVQMDGTGTSGRSKKFHDVCWKNLRDAGFPDRILWMKAAAAKYSFMDLSRVGIYGTSAGGQDALRAMLDHGDFYRVCVSDSGCHDNRMDKIWWNEQWMGWPVDESYTRSSNVTDAHKLQGKLLLMAGEMDRNVDPASTMQAVNALIKADKDFEMLVVPGAGHGVAHTPYGARRLEEFFVKNLLGEKN